jgi:hypothetical protein
MGFNPTIPIEAKHLERNMRLVLFNGKSGKNKVSKLRRVHKDDNAVKVWGPNIPNGGLVLNPSSEVEVEVS